jgi:delta-aminolevulinic acid dehydratase/porphobilinogen synthase
VRCPWWIFIISGNPAMTKGTTDIAMIRARRVVFESVDTPVPAGPKLSFVYNNPSMECMI